MNPIYKFLLNRPSSSNLLDLSQVIEHAKVNSEGQVVESPSQDLSGFMRVQPGQSYHCLDAGNNEVLFLTYYLYDAGKNYLRSTSSSTVVTPASDVAYIRVCYYPEDLLPAPIGFFPYSVTEFTPYTRGPVAYPNYGGDLSKEYNKEEDQQFFRETLSGKLTFQSYDYDFINEAAIDFKFELEIQISYDAGVTWASYWKGCFWKSDCEFDEDSKSVSVTPSPDDKYTKVLNALDREFNLTALSPDIVSAYADKRPIVQVYYPGDSIIYCLLPGMQWTEDCAVVQATDTVEGQNKLTEYFHFAAVGTRRTVKITGDISPNLTGEYSGAIPTTDPPVFAYYLNGNSIQCVSYPDGEGGYIFYYRLWQGANLKFQKQSAAILMEADLEPIEGSGATGTAHMKISDGGDVYTRLLTDVASVSSADTYELPEDDLAGGIRKFKRVLDYDFGASISYSRRYSSTPTPWGMYAEGQYYLPPSDTGNYLPILQGHWVQDSIWFKFSDSDETILALGTTPFRIFISYLVGSVIKRLLAQIDSSLSFSSEDSEFLSATINPVTGEANHGLAITPKSYLVAASFASWAQNAPITLGQVLEMLRDTCRCYWYIDDNSHFHIEHIKYFMNGLSYTNTPDVEISLITQTNSRNTKQLAYGLDKWKYDKPAMTAYYTFSWMDEVTQLFKGYPIEITSEYVDKSKTENIAITRFTSDFDYLLLSQSGPSREGFALLALSYNSQMGWYEVAYYTPPGSDYALQNGYAAFCYLQTFYAYDMPARHYAINGTAMVALGIKKLKLQEIQFAALTDPDPLQLIETQVGNGAVEKISVNLCSRQVKATLKYDSE